MAPLGQLLIENVIDPPARPRAVEHEDLGALAPLGAGLVLPIAVASIELTGMRGEEAHLGPTHEPARSVARPCHERDLKGGLRGRGNACRFVRRAK